MVERDEQWWKYDRPGQVSTAAFEEQHHKPLYVCRSDPSFTGNQFFNTSVNGSREHYTDVPDEDTCDSCGPDEDDENAEESHSLSCSRSVSEEEDLNPVIPISADPLFVPCLAAIFTRLVSLGHSGAGRITRFHAVRAPEISIKDYLERIQRYFCCSNECFVLALIYIDRVVKIHDTLVVSILNIHRLIITAVVLAAKFFDDVYYSNAFYARVGGVKTQEVNILEAHFLMLINYQLFVSPEEYEHYRSHVVAAVGPQIERILAPRDEDSSESVEIQKSNRDPVNHIDTSRDERQHVHSDSNGSTSQNRSDNCPGERAGSQYAYFY